METQFKLGPIFWLLGVNIHQCFFFFLEIRAILVPSILSKFKTSYFVVERLFTKNKLSSNSLVGRLIYLPR